MPDWSTELRERHRLFTDIIRLAKGLDIEFAFPTQTLYLRSDETPTHEGLATPGEAFILGRRKAKQVVRENLARGVIPPPVAFGPLDGDSTVDPSQIGEEGGDS